MVTTRVQVEVVTSPTCPNEPVGTTCRSAPVKGATVEIRSGSRTVAHATTGSDGRTTVQLAAGNYQVLARSPHGPPGSPATTPLRVGSAPMSVRVTIDSRLR